MKIAILGAGKVGTTLGEGWVRAGHEVIYGSRNPEKATGGQRFAAPKDAVAQSEVVVLTAPWAAVESILQSVGDFGGRPLIDATNPIGPGLSLLVGTTDSGAETVQRWAPTAKVVKAFNTTGVENMADPKYPTGRAVMFVCADDVQAKEAATTLASDLGFEGLAMGPLRQARLLEPLAALWISTAGQLKTRGLAFGLLRR